MWRLSSRIRVSNGLSGATIRVEEHRVGKIKGPYNAEFPTGTHVRVVERDVLEEFRKTWRYHHPLSEEQLDYGGHSARVKEVGYYHGGDELYTLDRIPGIWHECCLLSEDSQATC
jgi:hypothetical protein